MKSDIEYSVIKPAEIDEDSIYQTEHKMSDFPHELFGEIKSDDLIYNS